MKLKPTHRRNPIRRLSKSRAKQMRIYRKRVKEWLVGKRCAVYRDLLATQCHHIRGRIGTLLLDERFWFPVSEAGHWLINHRRRLARSKGWLCPIGQWNVPVPQERKMT